MVAANAVRMYGEGVRRIHRSCDARPGARCGLNASGEGDMVVPRIPPGHGRPPRTGRSWTGQTTGRASGSRIAATALQDIRQKTEASFHTTCDRKLMHRYVLTPKAATTIPVSRADSRAVNS